ncbi:MAG: Clp protease ClpP [Bacilli bacterium]|nr:Clp protease ClpP [Bacilli bacterium]
MNKEKFAFQKVDENNTELFIYGEIRKKDIWDMFFGDDDTRTGAFEFKDALAKVDTPNLTVRINSMGGSVSEGLAIYNLLNDFKGQVTTIVDGFACSAASVIFMAGDKRIVPESGLLMIHNAWGYAEGDSNAMKKRAEDLEKITQPSVNIYCSKTGLEESKVKEMMNDETWITSQEALELGFATTIEKNDANQSLENHYLHKMVMKLKELKRVQMNDVVKEEPQEEDAWTSFFNPKNI